MKLNALLFPMLVLMFVPACSDHVKDIGAPCELGIDAGANQATYNLSSRCSTGMCFEPVSTPSANMPMPPTGALCTASCSDDSDCPGTSRNVSDPSDRRCASGFTCAVAFVKGPLCCQKLCLCRDFLGPTGAITPIECQAAAATTCN